MPEKSEDGKKLLTQSIPDPQAQPIEAVRFMRDNMEEDLNTLISQKGLN